jgi:hypothetical protein
VFDAGVESGDGARAAGNPHRQEEETDMQFIVLVKATADSEAGVLPTREQMLEMGAFNEEMAAAGIMLAAEGLKPSKHGARISFRGGKPAVTDGPFAETKELVAGFWIIDVKSRDEAVAWMSRAPLGDGEIEIRPYFEISDFTGVITEDELESEHQKMRESLAAKKP